jgi:hypothetical protein
VNAERIEVRGTGLASNIQLNQTDLIIDNPYRTSAADSNLLIAAVLTQVAAKLTAAG